MDSPMHAMHSRTTCEIVLKYLIVDGIPLALGSPEAGPFI